MQTGFGMLESGCVSLKNEANIMMKNEIDLAFGAVAFFVSGWALAYGKSSHGFFGSDAFFLDELPSSDYAMWVFQFAFAATAATRDGHSGGRSAAASLPKNAAPHSAASALRVRVRNPRRCVSDMPAPLSCPSSNGLHHNVTGHAASTKLRARTRATAARAAGCGMHQASGLH